MTMLKVSQNISACFFFTLCLFSHVNCVDCKNKYQIDKDSDKNKQQKQQLRALHSLEICAHIKLSIHANALRTRTMQQKFNFKIYVLRS